MADDEPYPRPQKKKVGFALMDPERRRELARKGGHAVPADRRAFSQNKGLAIKAGRKGGASSHGGGRIAGQFTAEDRAGRARRIVAATKWDRFKKDPLHPTNKKD